MIEPELYITNIYKAMIILQIYIPEAKQFFKFFIQDITVLR